MLFRNLKTGNLLFTANKDVIEVMTSSPNYERVITSVEKPSDVGAARETTTAKGKKKASSKPV